MSTTDRHDADRPTQVMPYVLPEVTPAAQMMSVIARAAADPDCDVEKMERLMAMQERMIDRDAKAAFNGAFAAMQAEVKAAVRDARNSQTNSDYATLEAVDKAVRGAKERHGFGTMFYPAEGAPDGHDRIRCILVHKDGYEREFVADVPTDAAGIKGQVDKTATHAFGSTMTYGRRYMLMLVFDVPVSDDDGNAASADVPLTIAEAIAMAEEPPHLAAIRDRAASDKDVSKGQFLAVQRAIAARNREIKEASDGDS